MGKKAALLAVALAVAGLCILLWPVVSGHRLQADMSAAAQGFLEEARQPYPELLADLQGYNQRIDDIKNDSVVTADGELAFYFVHPSNLNVLPEQGVRAKVQELLGVLKGMAELELLALDSKESFQDNRQFYRQRLEAEDMPAIRGLLVQDRQHLDSVQTTMASSREFCFVLRRRKTDGAMNYAPLEQQFRDCGFVVQRAEGQRLLELLAIYFEQDATHEVFSFVDGAQWLTAETEV